MVVALGRLDRRVSCPCARTALSRLWTPPVSRDMKCCDSNHCNISHLVDISHFVLTFKLRQMLVLRHEM